MVMSPVRYCVSLVSFCDPELLRIPLDDCIAVHHIFSLRVGHVPAPSPWCFLPERPPDACIMVQAMYLNSGSCFCPVLLFVSPMFTFEASTGYRSMALLDFRRLPRG